MSKIYKDKSCLDGKIFPGDPHGLPDDFFSVVVFIDNAYLLRLKKYFFKDGLKFSVRRFVERVAKNNKCFVKDIYLYDAPPFQCGYSSGRENRMKEIYDKFVSRFVKEGIIVREGRTQKLKVGDSFVYRQKGVDMLLGIDMIGVLGDYVGLRQVVLLSGDSDFVPVIDKLSRQGVHTILWTFFDRKRGSPFSRCNDLIKSVCKYVKLMKEDFVDAIVGGEK